MKAESYMAGVRNARDHIQSITTLKQGAGFRHYIRGDAAPVLRLFRNSLSTDSRDKLWGFFGYFQWENPKYLPPDYNRSLVDVFTEVAMVTFKDSGTLYTLGETGRSKQDPAHSLPSWVADWACPQASLSLNVLGEGSKYRRKDPLRQESNRALYYAGGELDSIVDLFPLPGILSVKTKPVGRIAAVCSHPAEAFGFRRHDTEGFQEGVTRVVTLVEQCVDFAQRTFVSTPFTVEPISVRNSVFLTLIAGLNGYDSKTPWDVETYFSHWIRLCTKTATDDHLQDTTGAAAQSLAAMTVERALILAYGDGASFAVLDNQRIALVPLGSKVDDEVVVISGAPLVYVVRSVESQRGRETHELIGEAYTPATMDGQVAENQEMIWEDKWLI